MKAFLRSLTCVLLLVCSQSARAANELSADVAAAVNAAISAHESEPNRPRSGQGTATVVSRHDSDRPETQHVRFWYSGKSWRNDKYGPDAAGKEVLLSSIGDNGEFSYRYDRANSARINSSKGLGSGGYELGLNFHPASYAYAYAGQIAVLRILKNLRDHPWREGEHKGEMSTREGGLLELKLSLKSERRYDGKRVDETATTILVLDPAHAYRLVEYGDEQHNVNGLDSVEAEKMTINWKDYGPGESYPQSIKRSGRSFLSLDAWRNRPPEAPANTPRERTSSMDVTIDRFEPGGDIDKKFFTLDGVEIADGTRVLNDATGVRYTYYKVSTGTTDSSQRSPQPNSGR